MSSVLGLKDPKTKIDFVFNSFLKKALVLFKIFCSSYSLITDSIISDLK